MRAWTILGIGVGIGCGSTPEAVDYGPRGDCNPVDAGGCAYPFPSDFFLGDDATAATGKRVAFGPTTLPMNRDGVQVRPDGWNRHDGWSINSVLMTHLPGATVTGLVPVDDIGTFESADAKTVIVGPDGTRHPHWAELDVTSPEPTPEDDQRVLMLRPAQPYEWGTTYVAGIRGVVDASGAVLAASPGFAALRDGTPTDDVDIERQRAHYEEVVFPRLEAAGFPRAELQMAWSMSTATRDSVLGDMDWMKQDAIAWADANGLAYELELVEVRDCNEPGEHIARQIEGSITMPYYTERDAPSTFLARDEAGHPKVMGTKQVPFTMRVPCSVARGADGTGPVAGSAPVLQYGHGLLGSWDEVNSGYLAEVADRYGYILYASGWTGFKAADSPGIALMIALDPSDFAFIPEGSHQGMVEFMLGMRAVTGPMASDPALAFDGVAVVDPSQKYYYGNSQGGILGAAYLAWSPDITRGVLGVNGGPYSLLLTRSHDFEDFFRIFKEKFLDFRDISLFVNGLTQQVWDPVEPGGWMWDMTRDVETPKDVLMQVAIGDAQVTTLGAHYQARAYGASTVAPQTRPIWGIEEAAAPFSGPALVEWKYLDVPDEPLVGLPPDGPDTHECPRREPAAQDQLNAFLRTGVVEQFCDGACIQPTCP